ncbi:MAG TPA: hypothetical protein VGT81_22195, partial [Casimicrobiaceae bacterium]|nr:hypothetical protein [Casimicrobiaceae bacterium]
SCDQPLPTVKEKCRPSHYTHHRVSGLVQLKVDNLIDAKLCVNRPFGRVFRGEKGFRIILSLSFSAS